MSLMKSCGFNHVFPRGFFGMSCKLGSHQSQAAVLCNYEHFVEWACRKNPTCEAGLEAKGTFK